MNQIWWNRIASTQFLLFYPINSATLFVSQTGNVKLGTVLFMIGGGILLNYVFIKDLISIFKSNEPVKELYKDYFWVFAVALMNVSLFASFYHMFGIRSGEQILLHDWYNSFYFSIVTWTTLGYGDFSPVENLRLVTAAEAFIGYIYMAILIGLLLNTSQKLNNKNKS